ncbi:MAG: AMP-binding protein [Gammaproteobacteria bacterium]|nr:AMP-binding protein [Gammaproteobacteria bacterium]
MNNQLLDPLASFAGAHPELIAVVTANGESLSARQLDQAASVAAARLQALGAGTGTVVALEGEPGLAWLAALVGCWRLGAVAAPLNHRSTRIEGEQAARTLACQLHCTPEDDLLRQAANGHDFQAAPWTLERPLLRVSTSGSSGEPRCVELLASQLHFGAEASRSRLGHDPHDRWLVCLPVNHVGALAAIYRCLHNQICLELHTCFDVAVVADRLDSGEVSLVSLVPSMLSDALDHRGEQAFPKFLRVILLGGAPCSQSLLERCRIARLPVSLSWGMTETASQVATREPGDLSPLEDGLPPLPSVNVSVNEQGRLVVEGPIAAGRLVTDDLGEITAAGRVRVLGRSDEVIIRGGENIQPGEIEHILSGHPGVTEVCVLPRTDPRLGQVPVAFIQGRDLDPRTLHNWCRERLAGFKIPEEFFCRAELPRTAAGKIDRQRLLAQLNDS